MPVAFIPAALHTTAQIESARNSIIDSFKDYSTIMYSVQSSSNWIYMVLGHYYYFIPIWI